MQQDYTNEWQYLVIQSKHFNIHVKPFYLMSQQMKEVSMTTSEI